MQQSTLGITWSLRLTMVMQLSSGFLKSIVYISAGDFERELRMILEMSEFIFLKPV
jgi:hypothetical protein